MYDIYEYWKQVNQLKERLMTQLNSEDIWVMSLDNNLKGTKAGTVCAVEVKEAARRMIDKTHRLATAEEVEAHNAQLARGSDRAIAREQQRAARSTIVTPEQIAMLLRGIPITDTNARTVPKTFVPDEDKPEKTARSKQPAA